LWECGIKLLYLHLHFVPFSASKQPTYVAPEVLKNIPYDQTVDCWSVGIILYVILCGHPPFADKVQSVLFEKIRIGEYDTESQAWKNISDDAKQLVRSLLHINPQQRWTAKQALHCKWLVDEDPNLKKVVLAETYDLIRNRKSRLKNVARTIMWMNRHSLGKDDDSSRVATPDSTDSEQAEAALIKSSDEDSTTDCSDNEFSEKSVAELMVDESEEEIKI
jgi:serine/threonine protein kinase